MKKRSPPSNSSPLPRETVEAIIKRKSAPLCAPPLGFKPKDLSLILTKQKKQAQKNSSDDESSVSDNDSSSKSRNSISSQSEYSSVPYNKIGEQDNKISTKTFIQVGTPNKPPPKSEMKTLPQQATLKASDISSALVPATIFKLTNDLRITGPPAHTNFDFLKFLRGAKNKKLKQFLLSPCPPDTTIRCYIERDRFGSNMLSPVYTLCADLADGTGQELMACKKVFLSRSPHYVFSIMSTDLYKSREQRSKLYLGKLRSTVQGSYALLSEDIPTGYERDERDERDEGDKNNSSPIDKSVHSSSSTGSKIDENDPTFRSRSALKGQSSAPISDSTSNAQKPGSRNDDDDGDTDAEVRRVSSTTDVGDDKLQSMGILFHTTARPAPDGVRGCEICVPHPDTYSRSRDAGLQAPSAMKNLDDLFTKVRAAGKQNELYADECVILHERKTKYDPLSSCLVDYSGRANMASVKNFQLVRSTPLRSDTDEYSYKAADFVLQLGKTTSDCFNVDVRFPLSPFQAFAICVARFDAKPTWKGN